MRRNSIWDGSRLREARKAARLTQVELGRKIGADQTSISNWETGVHEPMMRHLLNLAAATGQEPRFFFADEEDEEEDLLAQLVSALQIVQANAKARAE